MNAEFANVHGEMGDFRKEVAAEFADVRGEMGNVRGEMGDFRKEVAAEFADLRKEMGQHFRNTILAVVGMIGVFTTVIIAFMRYGLPAG